MRRDTQRTITTTTATTNYKNNNSNNERYIERKRRQRKIKRDKSETQLNKMFPYNIYDWVSQSDGVRWYNNWFSMWFAFQFNDFQVNPLGNCLYVMVKCIHNIADPIISIMFYKFTEKSTNFTFTTMRCSLERWNSCFRYEKTLKRMYQTVRHSIMSTCGSALNWVSVNAFFSARHEGKQKTISK